jgi:hypothetical protein
MLNGDFAQ